MKMIHVQYMRPFYTKVTGSKLRLVFAYQYFSIMKEDEAFHFIPIEGKEIVVNLNTMQVENLSEVFVFQRGNRFIRLPLYQLLLVSNVHDHLMPILDSAASNVELEPPTASNEFDEETLQVINYLENENLTRLIDDALLDKDEDMFYNLLTEKQKMNEEFFH
jgi:hypothetical protein